MGFSARRLVDLPNVGVLRYLCLFLFLYVEVKEKKLILNDIYMIMSYKIAYPKEEKRQIFQKIMRKIVRQSCKM